MIGFLIVEIRNLYGIPNNLIKTRYKQQNPPKMAGFLFLSYLYYMKYINLGDTQLNYIIHFINHLDLI